MARPTKLVYAHKVGRRWRQHRRRRGHPKLLGDHRHGLDLDLGRPELHHGAPQHRRRRGHLQLFGDHRHGLDLDLGRPELHHGAPWPALDLHLRRFHRRHLWRTRRRRHLHTLRGVRLRGTRLLLHRGCWNNRPRRLLPLLLEVHNLAVANLGIDVASLGIHTTSLCQSNLEFLFFFFLLSACFSANRALRRSAFFWWKRDTKVAAPSFVRAFRRSDLSPPASSKVASMADSTCGGRSVDEPGWPRFSSSLSTALTVVSATCLAFWSNCRDLAGAEAFRLSFFFLLLSLALAPFGAVAVASGAASGESTASGAVSTAGRASSARQSPRTLSLRRRVASRHQGSR